MENLAPPLPPGHLPEALRGLSLLTPDELVRRRDAARRLVEDDGIIVAPGAYGRPQHLRVDPLPLVIPAHEWARLECGLAQRAMLLDAILADMYGQRTLVARGLLPPELIAGHPGFVPAADQLAAAGSLTFTAADLGRDGHGNWCVLADRTQAPLGAGYAMAVRRVIARVFAAPHRATDLRRLREFFDVIRTCLQPPDHAQTQLARVVMLTDPTPGPASFDESFTATLLGFPLVQPEDLAMERGQVWLRTTERAEPVDVILRRVAAGMADPLDLTSGNGTGVPGLVEASRRGVVRVVNPLGACVLEDPALAAFLPRLCSALLGEDLIVPSARTWWCGDEGDRAYVRAHLGELLIAPIAPGPTRPRVFASELTSDQRAELWDRVSAQPWAWCAQEVLPAWTVPAVTDAGLAQHAATLRVFSAYDGHSVTVMPGGLARLATRSTEPHVPSLPEALVKDVWVLADESAATESSPRTAERRGQLGVSSTRAGEVPGRPGRSGALGAPTESSAIVPVPLPPGAAEDLYWFGRYAERAESTARLVLVADDLVEDHAGRPGSVGYQAMQVLTDAIDAVTSVHRDRSGRRGVGPSGEAEGHSGPTGDPVPYLRTLVYDGSRHGTVKYSARRAAGAAAEVRELLSGDTWLVMGRLERSLGSESDDERGGLQGTVAMIVEAFLALAGIGAEGLIRDASWAYFDAGRRVERAQETVRVLRATVATARAAGVDRLVLEALLRARESLISHRRRTVENRALRAPLEIALDLLLTDASNPRSVRFSLNQLRADLVQAPSTTVDGAIDVPVRMLAEVDLAGLARDRATLAAYLYELESALRVMSATLDATSFRHRARAQVIQEPR